MPIASCRKDMSPFRAALAQIGRRPRRVRILVAVGLLGLLSACAGHAPPLNQSKEALIYREHTHNYTPPGPPTDPWGPYIVEASQRFDVPERWVREVMRVESGGQEMRNGEPVTSPVGAMGLMQVMPMTYDTLRQQYSLGDDPYDPHNSILAGTAYMRQMYDIYGTPGFLAAYNAGPARLDDYLSHNRSLPDETRNYVAKIGPYIADSFPVNRSPAEQYAANYLPVNIPPGPRFARTRLAERSTKSRGRHEQMAQARPVQFSRAVPVAEMQTASLASSAGGFGRPDRHARGGFHLIPTAMADTLPSRHGMGGSGDWAIQVGAFGNAGLAHAAAGVARSHAPETLASARSLVTTLHQAHGTIYRARLTGLSRDAAVAACEKLGHGHGSCMVISPDAQS